MGATSRLQDTEISGTRRRKRLRENSADEISIEEILPDDMGYDADVETIHPDLYEEPESDIDPSFTLRKKVFSVDEELAARMKHLGSERSGTNSPQTPYNRIGRKRRSLHDEATYARIGQSSDLEVVEIMERPRSNPSPPRKRRRKGQLSTSTVRSENGQTHGEVSKGSDDDSGKFEDRVGASDAMDVT